MIKDVIAWAFTLSFIAGCGADGRKSGAADRGGDSKLETVSAEPPKPNEVAQPAQLPPQKPVAVPAELAGKMGELLALYEGIRAALARDSQEGVTAAAVSLGQLAGEVQAIAPAELQELVSSIEWAAAPLEGGDASIETNRTQFGELSKAFVTLLAAAPSLAQGQHVFECPVAPGFKKWVQPTTKIQNPYMGTKMLACGSTSDLSTSKQ